MAAALELQGVTKVYGEGNGRVEALRGIDLTIDRGEMVAIVGPSGSGKSTLLLLLGALDKPTDGVVRIAGNDLESLDEGALAGLRRDTVGFVFQQFNLIPTLTARQNVEAAAAVTDAPKEEVAARVTRLLEAVGLRSRMDHLPSQLSGGEQQRVAIARALVNEPEIILADEPTGNLDSETGREILSLLKRVSDEGERTMVLITHDESIAQAAPRVVTLRDGQVA